MTDLGKDFGISKERVRQILKRYKARRTCANCYHQRDGFCSCRELSDMVLTPNHCGDWHPRKEG